MPLFMQKMAKIALWGIASGRDWTGTCPCVSETESERVLTWFWIWWLEIRPFFLFYKVGVAKTVALPSHSKLKTIVVGSAWLIDFILRFFSNLAKSMSTLDQWAGNCKQRETQRKINFQFSQSQRRNKDSDYHELRNKTLLYVYKTYHFP